MCLPVQFFDNPADGCSAGGRGKRPEELEPDALSERVGREIAHVTAHRADFTHGGPDWLPYGLYSALAPAMKRLPLALHRSVSARTPATASWRRCPGGCHRRQKPRYHHAIAR